jgi:hypothetical protein
VTQATESGCLQLMSSYVDSRRHARTSPFRTSIARSRAGGLSRSSHGLRLSRSQILTRLPVVLCAADCTRHGPTRNVGACGIVVDGPGALAPGVEAPGRAPAGVGEPPTAYCLEMFEPAKNEDAAASMLN